MTKKLLIVDDEELIREGLKDLLANTSLDIHEAKNGIEALSLLEKSNHWDLIVSDLRMPKMNGETFIRELLSRQIKTPLIIYSGHVDETSKNYSQCPNVYAAVAKPNHAKLVAMIRSFLLSDDALENPARHLKI